MITDQYEYTISAHWLPALINGDETGLTDDECEALDDFMRQSNRVARNAGFKPYHWAVVYDDYGFSRDYITGLAADCYVVALMVGKP